MLVHQSLRRCGMSSMRRFFPSPFFSNFTQRRLFLYHRPRDAGFVPSYSFPKPARTSRSISNEASGNSEPFALRFKHLAAVAILSFGVGSVYVLSSLSFGPVLTDKETLSAFVPEDATQAEVDKYINSHPLVASLRSKPEFTESRPHLKLQREKRQTNLTAGVLAGPGRIVVPPFVWSEEGGKSLVSITYLGPEVCGHPGIVHGGLLATFLDEGLALCCFPALPNRIGVTANLTLNYRKPVPVNSYVVLKARTVKVEGRKAWVEGTIETLPKQPGEDPVVLVDGSALMVEPKNAMLLKAAMPVAA